MHARDLDRKWAMIAAREKAKRDGYDIIDEPREYVPRVGFIYIARFGDYIKIGFAGDVDRRMNDLRLGLPDNIVLLAHKPGTPEDERALLKRFSSLKTRGEWFRADPELVRFAEEMAAE